MSASSYYNNDSSSGQGGGQQHHYQNQTQYPQNQQQQHYGSAGTTGYQDQQSGSSNPYGYPSDNTPQPYYGQGNVQSQQSHGQQYDNSQNYSSYNQYDSPSQSYGSGAGQPYQQPPLYGDNTSYPPHNTSADQQYNQYPSQDRYNASAPRQEGYDYLQQHQQAPTGDLQWGYAADPTASQPGRQAPYDPNNPEAERGFLGAVAGGALGAYGGHKMGHGVIGGIGGAIAGSKLQDYAKDKKKEKKAEEKRRKEEEKMRKKMANKQSGRRDSSSSSSSSSSDSSDDEKKRRKKYGAAGLAAGVGAAGAGAYMAGRPHQQQQLQQQGVQMRGNFSGSARDIQLDGDYDLIASLTDRHGNHKLSSIALNKHLSNEWGHFRWMHDGGNFGASARAVRLVDGGRVLEAELGDGQGGWNKDYVRLDEHVGNDDGNMVYVA